MSLFNIFNVSGSAMSAQSQRLNVVSSNIANAESTTSADGKTYRAKLTLPEGGEKLEMRGYIGIEALGRTQTWIRQ